MKEHISGRVASRAAAPHLQLVAGGGLRTARSLRSILSILPILLCRCRCRPDVRKPTLRLWQAMRSISRREDRGLCDRRQCEASMSFWDIATQNGSLVYKMQQGTTDATA